ncbi:MAG TPA: hydroxymethylbilane synthase [Bacilli bacterium]
MRTITVGTRQSALALTQTNQVVEHLKKIAAEHQIACDFTIRRMVTKGDQILDVMLSKVGGKGLFVKEIEQALLEKHIDIAVHSMKDMPSELPAGLMIGAIPEREDARDCLISKNSWTLDQLPIGARVGTSSLRRSCQLKSYRPDLQMESIRGNIDSRIRKLDTEGFDAIMLAAAGLHRMGWEDRITEYLPLDICLPAVGQGALAIECRAEDEALLYLLSKYNHRETSIIVNTERAFLKRLDGGCQIPIGAYGVLFNGHEDKAKQEISLTGMVGATEGLEIIKETMSGSDPAVLGVKVAEKLIERGADRILGR